MTVHKASLGEAQPISFDLDERTAELEAITNWKENLQGRLRAQFDEFEANLDPGELDELIDEVRRFGEACRRVRQ
jgi:hypothetical protein